MSDDRTKRGIADHRRVAGGEAYELEYFAKERRISITQAKEFNEG